MSAPSTPELADATSSEYSVKTRKTHTKSRGGCRECKRRKQKCNERKPVCSGCVKREITCVYLDKESSQARMVSSSISSASSSAFQPAPSQIGHFGMEDMELWHHYIKHTSEATSVLFGGRPELGLSCNYLLHGMLATAAIHLAYIQPGNRQKYDLLSRQHLDLALGPFQRAMTSVTDENIDYLFAYGTLLVVCSLASSQGGQSYRTGESSGGIADWVICVRGCRSISAAGSSNIAGLPIKQLIENIANLKCAVENAVQMSHEEERSFGRVENLLSRIITDQPANDEVATYIHAMEQLRQTFAFTVDCFASTLTVAMEAVSPEQSPERLTRRLFVTLWPFSVSDHFVQLLSEMKPTALLIMAHYCLILRRINNCWYMAESGLRIFQAIQDRLGEEWSTYLEYPRRVFGV